MRTERGKEGGRKRRREGESKGRKEGRKEGRVGEKRNMRRKGNSGVCAASNICDLTVMSGHLYAMTLQVGPPT